MKFRVDYRLTLKDGSENQDYFIVEGETLDEIKEKAKKELLKRKGFDPWSEEL